MTQQAPVGLRLKGQEINIRVVGGVTPALLASLDSIGSFNDELALKLNEDGFLGEVTNRFDEILDGYGGDFEMQLTTSAWIVFPQLIEAKATRQIPNIIFNIVRTDLFADGTSLVYVYSDVHFGAIPQKTGGRGDYVKVAVNFKTSTRKVLRDQL